MQYIEVEQKFGLSEPGKLKRILAEHGGESSMIVHQIDTYYNAPHRDFLAPPVISEWLRIRESDTGASVNYKLWLPTDAEIKTHCDEYETPVTDIDAIRRMLAALDFTVMVTVDKTREEWIIPGEVAVAFDTVTGVGCFVEFEFKGAATDADEAIKSLQQFIDKLDIDLGERINKGYPHMLLGR